MDNRTLKIQELKERYFLSDGSTQDKMQLKATIIEMLNKEESEEFQYEHLIMKAMEESDRRMINREIESVDKEQVIPVRRIGLRRIMSLAAVFAVVAVGIYSLVINSGDKDYNSAYLAMVDDYQKESLGKLSVRGTDVSDTYRDSLKQGIDLSIKGDYIASKAVLGSMLASGSRDELVVLHLSIDDFMIGNYVEAEQNLKGLLDSQDRLMKEEAEMLLAQLYIKQGMDAESVGLLSKLSATRNHKYASLAKEILKNNYDR